MKNTLLTLTGIVASLLFLNSFDMLYHGPEYSYEKGQNTYWFHLVRGENIEYLYRGIPGDAAKSQLVKTFQVKVGTPGESPTPLPGLVGKRYWTIIDKYSSAENPETAPYFLELDVPGWDTEPYGPTPYEECNGQCFWRLPGEFGLHGVNGDLTRLSEENIGSSGCVRHSDEDITYLYGIIKIEDKVRYYVTEDYLPFSSGRLKTFMSTSSPLSSFALTNTTGYVLN